ncbi:MULTISPECIES: hypothetical protein [Stutzerimonas stutzeri subgroup]|uniref:hypothetical protein n=1 Tax=Stutzerimonas stutzeri subgroup TaxID=578833 RepID=UPI00289D14EE|nr:MULTISPECIES: hypothetical protein [Stutzerimonas stutzeri subgroup]
MRDSAIRVLKLVGFGSACIVLGLYLGMSRGYDRASAQAVDIIAAAGCDAEIAEPLTSVKEVLYRPTWH